MTNISVLKNTVRHIGVFRFSSLGDIVRTIPIIKTLRENYPEAKIEYIVAKGYEEFLIDCPYIDKLIIYDRKPGVKDLRGFLNFALFLRKRKYDLIIDLQDNTRSHILLKIIAPQHYISYIGDRFPELQSELLFHKYLEAVGIKSYKTQIELWTNEKDKKYCSDFFKENSIDVNSDLIIGFGIIGKWKTKRWLPERYAATGNLLIEKWGAKIIIFGGTSDIEDVKQISNSMKPKPAIAAGKMTLLQSAYAIKFCKIFICNDSSLMHIASLNNVPIISIFGPTNPKVNAPAGEHNAVLFGRLDCAPCHSSNCRFSTIKCMEDITVDMMWETIEKQRRYL